MASQTNGVGYFVLNPRDVPPVMSVEDYLSAFHPDVQEFTVSGVFDPVGRSVGSCPCGCAMEEHFTVATTLMATTCRGCGATCRIER